MSAATIRTGRGVIVRYETDVVVKETQKAGASVAQMVDLLRAERATRELWALAQHIEISENGRSAIFSRLNAIHDFIHRQRVEHGMTSAVRSGFEIHLTAVHTAATASGLDQLRAWRMKRLIVHKTRAVSPFAMLNQQHQREAVLKLADTKVPDHGIASMTGLNVGDVRRIIAARAAGVRMPPDGVLP